MQDERRSHIRYARAGVVVFQTDMRSYIGMLNEVSIGGVAFTPESIPTEQMRGSIHLQLGNFNEIISTDARIIWCTTTRVGVAFTNRPAMLQQAIPWLPHRHQEIDCATKITTVIEDPKRTFPIGL